MLCCILYIFYFSIKGVLKRITTTKFDYFEKIHIHISKEIISLLPRYIIRLKIKNIVKEKNMKNDNDTINHFQRYLKEYRHSVMT